MKKGRQYRVERVTISGNTSIPLADFEPSLRIRAGQPFSDAKLDADTSLIEDLYHRRGFAGAKAQAAVEPQAASGGDVPVLVTITIREGVRVLVGSVRITGQPVGAGRDAARGLGLQPGRPYFQGQLLADRDQIQLQYANLGYPNATVDANPNFSADLTRADPVFTVREGPRVFVDHVLIVGNVRTSAKTIEHELQVKPGDPLGLAAVSESQRRLTSLGLFRRARLTELGTATRPSATCSSRSRRRRRRRSGTAGAAPCCSASCGGRKTAASPRSVSSSRPARRSRSAAGTCSGRTGRSTCSPASPCTRGIRRSSPDNPPRPRAPGMDSANTASSARSASRVCSTRRPT